MRTAPIIWIAVGLALLVPVNFAGCGKGTCTGMPWPCGGEITQDACQENRGCTWSPGACAGTVETCASHPIMSLCTTPGCTWTGTACVGTAGSCASRASQGDCLRHADGCTWAEQRCRGEAAPCAEYGDVDSCSAIIGCSWD